TESPGCAHYCSFVQYSANAAQARKRVEANCYPRCWTQGTPSQGKHQPMPKPCPRCGLENADEAARCRRCDAPLPAAAAITPAFRRFLLWLAAFFVISAIGVA